MTRVLGLTFTIPMVQGILARRKRITRRIAGAKPPFDPGDLIYVREPWRTAKYLDHRSPTQICEACLEAGYRNAFCDMRYEADKEWHWSMGDTRRLQFEADDLAGRYRQAMHMPKDFSRLTLRVTSVRREPLQAIIDPEARLEGVALDTHCETCPPGLPYYVPGLPDSCGKDPIDVFRKLWDSINLGRGYGWDSNPDVYAIGFELHRTPIKQMERNL